MLKRSVSALLCILYFDKVHDGIMAFKFDTGSQIDVFFSLHVWNKDIFWKSCCCCLYLYYQYI